MMKLVVLSILLAVAIASPQPGGLGDLFGGATKALTGTVGSLVTPLEGAVKSIGDGVGNMFVGSESGNKNVQCDASAGMVISSFYGSVGVRPIPGTQFCSCPLGFRS